MSIIKVEVKIPELVKAVKIFKEDSLLCPYDSNFLGHMRESQ
jgi:hypothetical protein